MIRAYHILLRHLNLFKEALVPADRWQEAYRLCADIDPSDTPHVAIALTLSGQLWTGDRQLIEDLRKNGFDDFFHP